MASVTLRRVGWALIAVGMLDIGYMAYCIANQLSYGSSFNIFAVIAGVFLLRQNVRAAKLVAWFAGFLLTGFTGAVFLLPILTPLDLWAVQLRLNPVSMLLALVVGIAVVAFVAWTYRELTSPALMDARRSAGIDAKKPMSAFVAGAALVIGLGTMLVIMTQGSSAAIAKEKAEQQLGDRYKYHVTSMHWSGSGGRATVTAYNDAEIREVEVKW